MYKISSEEDALKVKKALLSYGEFLDYPHSTEMYGIGYWLKKKYGLPAFIKLDNWEILHGPPLTNEMYHRDLECTAKFLFYNSEQKNNYSKYGKKGMVVGSSFMHCRKMNNIEKNADAAGTIVFPIHSTKEIKLIFGWSKYIEQLLALPKQFHPVSVCLYYREILNDDYKEFLNKGIDVYCSGHMCDNNFPVNFYNILKRFKYASSNMTGSYSYYAVEMGIPFFIYGNEPLLINHGGDRDFTENTTMSFLDSGNRDYLHMKAEYEKFSYEVNKPITISLALKEYIENKLGSNEKYNLTKVKFVFWMRYLRFLMGVPIRYVLGN